MNSALEASIDYLRNLSNSLEKQLYIQELGKFLLQSGANYPENQDVVELFLEYAELTEDNEQIFSFMMDNSIGRDTYIVFNYFFQKFKKTNLNLAKQCIDYGRQYLYTDFNKLDEMNKELDEILEQRLYQSYQSQNYTNQVIIEKMRQFKLKKYTSKSKKIVIDLDNDCRTHRTSLMLQELNKFQQSQQINHQNHLSIFSIQNPEETEDNDEINAFFTKTNLRKSYDKQKPKIEIEIPKTPSIQSIMSAISELISKMPSKTQATNSSSTSFQDILNFSNAQQMLSDKKALNQQKLIINMNKEYQTNVRGSQYKRKFDFTNIPKLRQRQESDSSSKKSNPRERLQSESPKDDNNQIY